MTRNTRSFESSVALITGGAAGIGKATVLAFASRGTSVSIADVKVERGEELAHAVEALGAKAMFVKTDVSSPAEVERLVADTVKRFERIDFAFNNAGIEGQMGDSATCSEENFDRVIGINLKGLWLCQRLELRQMLAQQTGGAIVNMSSVAGKVGFANLPAYVASKHGVIGLTKSAALEYATQGIRVNAVCPGVIHTEMIDRVTGKDPEVEKQFIGLEPMGRMGSPEEIATAVVWLCSEEASFVTGQALGIDGGFLAR